MKDFLKKYGVIVIATTFFVCIIGYFAYDKTKDYLPSKKQDGADVVFSINNQNITADALFDDMYKAIGDKTIVQEIEKIVISESIVITDKMKEDAKNITSSVLSNFQNQYGAKYQDELSKILRSLGYNDYNDLEAYMLLSQQRNELMKQYVNNNIDTIYKPYAEENKPRTMSHILVKCVDSANPTDEEKAKMKQIDEELAKGTAFSDVATKFSDDTGSAVQGGSLGFMDAKTQFVPEFLEASLKLNDGETSEWVKTQFGFHKLQCGTTKFDDLKEMDELYNQLTTLDETIFTKAIWEKAKTLNIDFMGNDELKASVLKAFNVTE